MRLTMQEGTPLAFLHYQTASLRRCCYVKNQNLVRDVSSKLTRGSEEPQVSCFQVYRFFIMARYIHCLFSKKKKIKACLTEAVLFSSGRRELFQSTPLRTKSVPVGYVNKNKGVAD